MNNSFIGIDAGASSTRFVSENAKIGILPNNMVILDMDEPPVDVYISDNSVVNETLELYIKKDSDNDYFPVHVLMGSLATRVQSVSSRPNSNVSKHKQQLNYISIIAATAINKMTYGLTDEINVYVALPPVEVQAAKEYVSNQLEGSYKVDFPKMGKSVEFTIKSVTCLEESYMALLSWFFDMSGNLREEAKAYARGNILGLDIGASTADLAIVSDMHYLDKSGKTYKTGGNIAREYLTDCIRADYSFEPTDDDVFTAISEGRLQLGNAYVDVSQSVAKAKKELAEQIVAKIQTYFGAINVPLQSIRAVVVSGGGSLPSEYISDNGETIKTTEPVSSYITTELQKVCKGVDVIYYDNSPRLANVRGLFIRASLDVMREKKKAQQV